MKTYQEVQGREVPSAMGTSYGSHYDLTPGELNEYAKQGWTVVSVGWGKNPQNEPVMRRALLSRKVPK